MQKNYQIKFPYFFSKSFLFKFFLPFAHTVSLFLKSTIPLFHISMANRQTDPMLTPCYLFIFYYFSCFVQNKISKNKTKQPNKQRKESKNNGYISNELLLLFYTRYTHDIYIAALPKTHQLNK